MSSPMMEQSRMTLHELLESHGVEYRTDHRDVRQGWIGLKCPWCGGEDEYYLGINVGGLWANCWRCGPHSLASILAEVLNINIGTAIQRTRDLPRIASAPEIRPTGHVCRFPSGSGPLMRPHRAYLRSRGFNPKRLARIWGIQGIGQRSRWAWRILIPAFHRGKPVSWTTRSINPDEDHSTRYMEAPPEREKISLHDILYGGDLCRHSVVVMEGPTGAWRFGPGAVATNGLSLSGKQLEQIAKYPVRAVVFDHEKDAQKRARKLTDALSVFPGETFLVDLDSADPGTATEKEVRKIRKAFLE